MIVKRLLIRLLDIFAPPRRLEIVNGDSLPAQLPYRALILAREDDEDWCIGMRCPCGCGRRIELLLIKEAAPRWSLKVDRAGHPSLSPSVRLRDGCQSHFWVHHGRIRWC